MSSTLPLTLLSLEKLIETDNNLIVLDCYATWCGPCKKISEPINKMAEKYDNNISVLKADMDECEDISIKYRITSLPTILFFKHGQEIDRVVGSNMELIYSKVETYWK